MEASAPCDISNQSGIGLNGVTLRSTQSCLQTTQMSEGTMETDGTQQHAKLSNWNSVLFGQGIALCLAICSMNSAALQDIDLYGMKDMQMPLFQLSTVYLSLIVHLFLLLKSAGKDQDQDRDRDQDQDQHWIRNADDNGSNEIKKYQDIDAYRDGDCADQESYLYPECYVNGDDEERAPSETTFLFQDITRRGTSSSSTLNHSSKDVSDAYFWRKIQNRLHSPWYFYALLAFLDVQANYFVVLSFRYTAAVNSTILGSLSILSVMIASKVILGRKFQRRHFLGALLCILGASLIVTSDSKLSGGETASLNVLSLQLHPELYSDESLLENNTATATTKKSRLLGDIFAITAALLFGLNDTLAEYSVQNSTPNEYLGMVGFFGYVFSICQSLIFEHHQVRDFVRLMLNHYSAHVTHEDLQLSSTATNTSILSDTALQDEFEDVKASILPMFSIWIGYCISFYCFYVMASNFLTIADATILTLSLQTSNIWMMLFSVFVQQVTLSPLFFCSAGTLVFGVWLYERGPPPSR